MTEITYKLTPIADVVLGAAHLEARDGDNFVGVLTIFRGPSGWLTNLIYVKDAYQRQGIGTRLYDIANNSGMSPILPTNDRTPDGLSLWQSSDIRRCRAGHRTDCAWFPADRTISVCKENLRTA